MAKIRHTEQQMIGAVKELEAGHKAKDVARELGVSTSRIYQWKAKYVDRARETNRLRDEDTRLRKLIDELILEQELD